MANGLPSATPNLSLPSARRAHRNAHRPVLAEDPAARAGRARERWIHAPASGRETVSPGPPRGDGTGSGLRCPMRRKRLCYIFSMPVRFRVIVAFLILALPLQGMAAVSRVPCASSHGQAAPTTTATGQSANAHDGGHAARAAPTVDGHAMHHEVLPPGGESGASIAASGADRCAHCADCSVGSAILDSTVTTVAFDASRVGFPSKAVTAHPRPFGGPDRPPRTP